MGRDVFVSYASADRVWAEWIGWQLKQAGLSVVLQAWDMLPGGDFVHEMQRATTTAGRTIAVLSPAYLSSQFGEAEWRVAFANDPSGEKRLLIPVRVAEVDPPGLLATKIYIDLVGKDRDQARRALLDGLKDQPSAVPPSEPPFPGGQAAAVEVFGDAGQEPRFPTAPLPPEGPADAGRVVGSGPAAPGRIFISYRRAESAYPTGWLYDRLASHFGRDDIVRDIDSIELGDDFVKVIDRAVASCDVMLVVIGTRWISLTDNDGRRRLDDPDDFVRREIEAALERAIRIIPVLVDGATVPRSELLPPSLAKLSRYQALVLSPDRFQFDADRLLPVLDKTVLEEKMRHYPKSSGT